MAITGGIKIFKVSKALFSNGDRAIASSGTSSADFILDTNRFTFWRSVASSDATTETLTITMASSTIDRIAIANHNFKSFNIKYWNGAAFVDFTSVISLNGSLGSVSETANADATSYYEFDSVTTDQIRIEATETFVVDDEKNMMQLIATEEIHTFTGFPDFKPKHSRNIRKHKMMSGRTRIEKSEESFTAKIQFKNYDADLADDIDTAYFLVDSEDPFILWACGGKRELSNDGCFRYQQKGWRLEDFYTCHVTRDISPNYKSNYYGGSLNLSLSIEETT